MSTPQAVSRQLRSAGYLPVPRDREGVHVSRSRKAVYVWVDLDNENKAKRWALEIVEVLNELEYEVKVVSPTSLYVTKGD